MATSSSRTVTMSLEERNLLVSQNGNWAKVMVRVWEKHGQRRVYVNVGGDKRDSSHMDLNDNNDLELMFWNASAAQAVADFINALVEVQAPVIEEKTAAEEISEPVLRATVIDSNLIDEAVAEMESETARYHAHFAEQAATLGMTGEELEMAFVDWRDAIVAPIAKAYNPDRPWFGWAHIQNSLKMWDVFFAAVATGDLKNLPTSMEYAGGEPEIVF